MSEPYGCGPYVPKDALTRAGIEALDDWAFVLRRPETEISTAFLVPRWGDAPLEGMTPNLSIPGRWESVTERLRELGVWWPGE